MKVKLLKSTRCNRCSPAPQQLQSTPLTPPVVARACSCRTPSSCTDSIFHVAALPPIQPTTRPPPPPPPGPPPSEESPQVSQPVTQQQAQPEPSVPSQQSLPSTHRCPDVLGPAAPMTQEYVPHGGAPRPPMTPTACLQEGMARVPVAPSSPPGCHGGMQAGSPPRLESSPPPPPLRKYNLLVMEAPGLIPDRRIAVHHMLLKLWKCKPLPTSAGVSEPSLYQHSNAPPLTTSGLLDPQQRCLDLTCHMQGHIQPWLSTLGQVHLVHQMEGTSSGGVGLQPNTQPPTQPRIEQPISKNKSSSP